MTAQLAFTLSEVEKGRRIKEAMADDDGLVRLRKELRRLYLRRTVVQRDAWVSADDARRLMSQLGITFNTNNRLGSLWNRSEWVKTGARVKSETPGSHGNELFCWKLR